jgi:hypothetical protein
MLGLCALCAYQRNELNPFWTGFFYDEILLFQHKNDLENASGRSSVDSIRLKKNPEKVVLNEIELQVKGNRQ